MQPSIKSQEQKQYSATKVEHPFKSKDIREKLKKNPIAKFKFQSTSYISSNYSERQMNVELDSIVQKLKFKQWQQKVIRDARVNNRCTTAACIFEDSPRIQRIMEDAGNYKLLTLEDLELICLNRGCRALPCAKHYS